MSRKKRLFDIDMPEEGAAPAPASSNPRRGPMASAISENAKALRDRKSAAEAIREENDALAHEFVALREEGHVVQMVPLDDVHTYMLARDRIPGEDPELAELVTSIRELGLSNPIRVIARPDGEGFELVQGFRRLSAYRELLEETGQGDWASIPALVLPGVEDIPGLYRRMVDENVIRKDLSFAEMAHAAKNYAADPATEVDDVNAAVAALFQSAPYSKRSYIRSFAFLLDRLDGLLDFPTEIPRALGLTLAREIKDRPEIVGMISDALSDWDNRSVQDELGVLRRFAQADESDVVEPVDAPQAKRAKPVRGGRTKTTFHIQSSAGPVKCMAAQGRLEIKVDRDFSAIERARLERAVASLIDGLG